MRYFCIFFGFIFGLSGCTYHIQDIETNIVQIKTPEILISHSKNPKGLMDTHNPIPQQATAFFINNSTIITSAHLVNKNQKTYSIIDKDMQYTAKLEKIFLDDDIAFLSTKKTNKPTLAIETNIQPGEVIYSYGYNPETEKIEKKSGEILQIKDTLIITNIPLKKGNSGGPITNKQGKIIAINTATNIHTNTSIGTVIQIPH